MSKSKLMYNQKWVSLNDYSLDYFELLFQYYATCGKSIPVTYYSLDIPNSTVDSTVLQGGSYEMTGDLSGWLWKKISMLQVYSFEPTQFNLTADDEGVSFKDRTSSLWIPSIYELKPAVHDFICFDFINSRNSFGGDQLPVYEVMNLEKASSTGLTFWKVILKSTFRRTQDIDKQLSGTYTFVDYEKHIYTSSDSILLTKLQLKNSKLPVNSFYKENIGLFVS